MKTARSGWQRTILVCGKCEKRTGRKLAKDLRRAFGVSRSRKATIGIVETKCLGICPKRGIVVLDAASPQHWRIVGDETTAKDLAGAFDLPVI